MKDNDQKYTKACGLLDTGDIESAFTILESLVTAQHTTAILKLADLYAKGVYVEQDTDAAIRLLRMASSLGSEEASRMADVLENMSDNEGKRPTWSG